MSGTPTPPNRSHRLARAALAAAACAALGACADVGRALTFGGNDINVESPVAGAALAATHVRYVTPRLSEVPPVPLNAPSGAEIKRRVQAEAAQRARLERWVAAHPQMNDDTEGFATAGRAVAAKAGAAPETAHMAAAEAWAAQMRASAVPPPPPQ